MCGLFGFVGHGHSAGRLTMAAMLAAKRGPDGWGIVTDHGEARDLGRLPEQAVSRLRPCGLVVGHCRLATVPDTRSVRACQPLRVGRFVVAHNGTVANADELQVQFGFSLATGNDSETIGHLLERIEGPVPDRITAALRMTAHGGHFALAVLDEETGRVHLKAERMPLWRLVAPEGMYWCSIRPNEAWEAVGV